MNSIDTTATPSSAKDSLTLSVVMPCYNEMDSIEPVLREWLEYLRQGIPAFEVLLINDGSTDGTGRILDRLRKEFHELRVIHQLNSGHGRAVRRGYELVRGQYVLQVDTNGRYRPEDFTAVWENRALSPLILARRAYKMEALLRRVLARLLYYFSRLFFGIELQDPNSPFRLCQQSLMRDKLAQLPRDLESVNLALALLIARDSPTRVLEIPIPFRPKKGTSQLTLVALGGLVTHYIFEMARVRYGLWKKRKQLPALKQSQAYT